MRWALISLALLAYAADRWAILAGSGHLMYALDEAEYGFIRVVGQVADRGVFDVLGDPQLRLRFLHGCRTVGNQVHGTLGLAGISLLAAVRWLGASLSTRTLEGLAIAGSTTALAAWALSLWGATRAWRPVAAFVALFILAPRVFLKLSTVFWGTHDMVVLVHALLLAAALPFIARPGADRRRLLGALLVGAVGGLATLANYALLLPVALLGAWLVLASWRRPLTAIAVALAGLGAWYGVGQGLRATGWLQGLGVGFNPQHLLLLGGKGGRAFLFAVQPHVDLAALRAAWPDAMPMAPGADYGPWASGLEGATRAGLGLMALWAVARLWWWRESADRVRAFLGFHLLLGWLGVTLLSLGYGLEPGALIGVRPRYYAPLYPVAFALVALSAVRPVGLLPLGFMLLMGGWDHHRVLDLGNLGAWQRYDGVRAYLSQRDDPHDRVPASLVPMASASDAFVRGFRLIQRYQAREYWSWTPPARVRRPIHGEQVRRHLSGFGVDASEDDFWRGMGYALSVVVPPSRRGLLNGVFAGHPAHREALIQGYEMAPPP